ncbi:MAG TPA: aminotransferase class III-fold pyridoxal phosphate-dependent enzyme [Candidatus Deferrimicrobium sp.]|nr:aminotransferase class III-fold pyridoxal phosphate-dependent enzyme [Candidatus Deferrimicrobium sp.]
MTDTSPTIRDRSLATLSPVLGRYFQQAWVRGEGHRLFDSDGRSYLDFANGIAVTSLGHAHPRVNAAIHAQVDQLLHVCNGLGHLESVTRLAEMIVEEMPEGLDTVYFGNSGAEVVDGALKLARRASGRSHIIAFSGAFHGRTYGAISVTTSSLNYRTGYDPLLPDVHIAPFPYAYRDFGGDEEAASASALGHLERLFATIVPPSRTAAFIIEPVQGEGGYVPAPASFLRGLRELADRHGILLIADEVQSGYGRTGRMWAFEHAGIVPHIVLAAKAIANGMPLAALISSRDLQQRWGVGAHGSTYGGNPVSCAAGIAVLEVIREESLVANAAERGAELTRGLEALAAEDPRIGDVRGPGLMIGVELVLDRETRQPAGELGEALTTACADRGLLLLTCGPSHNIMRWIAPVDVSRDEVEESLGIFQEALLATR